MAKLELSDYLRKKYSNLFTLILVQYGMIKNETLTESGFIPYNPKNESVLDNPKNKNGEFYDITIYEEMSLDKEEVNFKLTYSFRYIGDVLISVNMSNNFYNHLVSSVKEVRDRDITKIKNSIKVLPDVVFYAFTRESKIEDSFKNRFMFLLRDIFEDRFNFRLGLDNAEIDRLAEEYEKEKRVITEEEKSNDQRIMEAYNNYKDKKITKDPLSTSKPVKSFTDISGSLSILNDMVGYVDGAKTNPYSLGIDSFNDSILGEPCSCGNKPTRFLVRIKHTNFLNTSTLILELSQITIEEIKNLKSAAELYNKAKSIINDDKDITFNYSKLVKDNVRFTFVMLITLLQHISEL